MCTFLYVPHRHSVYFCGRCIVLSVSFSVCVFVWRLVKSICCVSFTVVSVWCGGWMCLPETQWPYHSFMQIPRYILTLHELLAHTPHEHVERNSLEYAKSKLEELSRYNILLCTWFTILILLYLAVVTSTRFSPYWCISISVFWISTTEDKWCDHT